MKRLNLNTDTTLSDNSNTLASSQKAIKNYADTKLKNTATGTDSVTVEGTAATDNQATNIGKSSSATTSATAIGYNAVASASGAIQIGDGTNNTANTFQVKDKQVLDSNGTLVSDRIPYATDTTKGGIKVEFDSITGTLNIITE